MGEKNVPMENEIDKKEIIEKLKKIWGISFRGCKEK